MGNQSTYERKTGVALVNECIKNLNALQPSGYKTYVNFLTRHRDNTNEEFLELVRRFNSELRSPQANNTFKQLQYIVDDGVRGGRVRRAKSKKPKKKTKSKNKK